ncbi:MAG: hypothetical protein AAGC93_02270 [Cyanobacteria bacterium P01_F01_bin.53]
MPKAKPASEYIDGQILQKPMPTAAHVVQGELIAAIQQNSFDKNYISPSKSLSWVLSNDHHPASPFCV